MSEARVRTIGGFSGRKALRTVIWVALAAYTAYLSTAALAEPFKEGLEIDLYPAVGPLGLHDIGKLPALGAVAPGKALIFERPTPADPKTEISCLALNIYHEARGEPGEGKLAVGHVVMNRVEDARFPASVCEVVKQGGWKRRARCQFSWWCDGRPDDPSELPAWEDSLYHARQVLWRATEDPTSGALWYHADHVAPSWRKQMIKGPKIGKHIFYRGRSRG